MPKEAEVRPGRNEACHCGSGKKYKQCCLVKDEAARSEARKKAAAEAPPPSEEDQEAPRPKHQTHQPWTQRRNEPHGFRRVVKNRRTGES